MNCERCNKEIDKNKSPDPDIILCENCIISEDYINDYKYDDWD